MIIDRTLRIQPIGFQMYEAHYPAGDGGGYKPLRIASLSQLSAFLQELEVDEFEREEALGKLDRGDEAELPHIILTLERAMQLGLT